MLSIDWFGSAPVCRIPGGEEVGVTKKRFIQGRSAPRSNPFSFAIFDRKGTPFIYLLLKNGTPFTYLVDNFASHSTALNTLSLTAVRQNQNVSSTFFTAI